MNAVEVNDFNQASEKAFRTYHKKAKKEMKWNILLYMMITLKVTQDRILYKTNQRTLSRLYINLYS